MRAYLLIALLFLFPLHASIDSALPSSLHGSVDVIAGRYVEDAPQIVLHSPFELGLYRTYIGPDKLLHPLCWSMGVSSLSFERNEPGKICPNGIVIDDLAGSRLLYAYEKGSWVPYPEGVANDRKISFRQTKEQNGEVLFRVTRNSEELIFASPNTKNPDFFAKDGVWRTLPLARIERAHGERVEFAYEEESGRFDAPPRPKSVRLVGSTGQELGWIRYEGNALLASDGQRVGYELHGPLLRKIIRPGWPDISYSYNTSTHSRYTKEEQKHLVRLARRQEGDLFLENSYYEAGGGIKGATFDKDNKVQNPLVNCVKEQFANVGERADERVSIARFDYHFDPHKDFRPHEVSGWANVTDASGHRTQYTWCEGQRITSIERYQGLHTLLVRESYPLYESGWRLFGKVVSDPSGPVMAITVEQSSTGEIRSQTIWGDLTGRSSPLAVDENGFPKESGVDCLSHTFAYQSKGKVSEERIGSLCKLYQYDGDRLSSIALFDGDRLYERLSFEYDANGAVVEEGRQCGSRTYATKIQRVAKGPAVGLPERIEEYAGGKFLGAVERKYGPLNLVVSETYLDANNLPRYTLHAKYDLGGRPIWVTDAEGGETLLAYDRLGRLSSIDETTYAYDHANRLTSVAALGSTRHYRYDCHNRIVQASGNHQEVSFSYDALNRLVESRGCQYEYDALGNCTQCINALGEVERCRYTVRGQVAEAHYADGTSERYAYDLLGNLIEKIDRFGVVTKATYNGIGQITSVTKAGEELLFAYDGDLMISIDDGDLKTTLEYDYAGRLIEVRSGERCTQYRYDALGRPCREIVWFGYGLVDHIDTVTEYDLCNRVVRERVEDGEGQVWNRVDYAYDKSGNLVAMTTYGEGERPETTRFAYDLLGRVTQLIDPLGALTTYTYGEEDTVTDALGSVTKQRYDCLGRVASIEKLDSNGTLLARTEYSYDAAGQLTDERHSIVLEGKVVGVQSIGVDGGSPREEQPYSYTYDKRGNIVLAEGPDGVTKRSYDLHGQLTSEQLSNGRTISYEYDRAGRRVATHLPDGSTVRYTYDPIGVCRVQRDLFSHTVVSRDPSGRPLLERAEPFGLDWSYKWDEAGQLVEERSLSGTTHLAYDALGRLILAQGRDGAGRFKESYVYDSLSQLIAESGTHSHEWKYDSLGNRRGDSTIHCDRKGCVQNVVIEGHGRIACDYDRHNQLTLLNTTTQGWRYTYDSFGRRVKERHTTGSNVYERDYLYDGDVEIGSLEGDHSEIRFTMARGWGQRPRTVGMEVKGELFSAATNYRGDITALFDQRGDCVETMRYSSFGEREFFGQEISSWGFCGKRHDPSGLVYFGRRYYLPSEGRWMTPDPAGFIDGPNLHQFCHNSPHSFVDWIGLKSEKPSGGIGDLDSGKGWGRVDQKPGGGFQGYIYFGPPKMYHPRPTAIRILPPKLPLPTWAGFRTRACASGHGVVRYSLSVLHDVQEVCTVIGADDLERAERIDVMEWLESDQAARALAVDLAVMQSFGVDGSDPIYQKYCRHTEIALNIGSWVIPAVGAGRTLLLPRLMRKLGRPTAVVRAGRLGSSVRACEVAGSAGEIIVTGAKSNRTLSHGLAVRSELEQSLHWGVLG